MSERLNILQGTPVVMRVGGILLLTLLLAGLLAAPADAEPRIKVHCEVYDTNYVDPIALTQHAHHQIGNTSTTNESTGDSLFSNPSTSCNQSWFTSAGWFPVERYETEIRGVNVYYRAPGDQTEIKAIPEGLQLLGTREGYVCGSGGSLQPTPLFDCTGTWATTVTFPDCIDASNLADESTNAIMSRNGVCPSSHPYRIPRISFRITHLNPDGRVANPLEVSAGVNEWHDYTFMHADYFAANQPVFNDELLDLCLRDAPDSVTSADPRCGDPPAAAQRSGFRQ